MYSVLDIWLDASMKGVVEGKIGKTLIGADVDRVWGRLFVDTLLTKVVGLIGDIEEAMEGGAMLKESAMGIF